MTYWVYLRCLAKLLRHSYNAYLALNLKFEYYWIDWIRMTSFYILYISEYLISLLLIVVTLPHVKGNSATSYSLPNELNFHFDLTLVYFLLLCMSVPNFVSTFVYLHKKRAQQLYYVYGKRKEVSRSQ